jgi:hypothetical protein
MEDLCELTFEEVSSSLLDTIIAALLTCPDAQVKNVSHNEGGDVNWEEYAGKLLDFFKRYDIPSCILINANKVKISDVVISGPTIRIVYYGSDVEINILFDSNEVVGYCGEKGTFVFYENVKKFAEKMGILIYYCGLEPATDENTRFFSPGGAGPLYMQCNKDGKNA